MKNKIVPFCFIFLFLSCSHDPSNNESTKAADSIGVDVHQVKKMKEYKGVYHPGQFKNAEDSELYTFSDSVQKKLDSLYSHLLPAPYPNQTVFMHFKGVADSFPTNTDFRTSITELIVMELKNAFSAGIAYDYWCMGNEPFWQVQISENENLIDFYDPMIPKFYHFVFSKAEIKGNQKVYTAEGSGNKIKITIVNEICSDGMSERIYKNRSEVVLNGKTYKGCAVAYGDGLH
ncbi:MAG: hypothetical protein V4511_13465 [Bacteroidota bacterium]